MLNLISVERSLMLRVYLFFGGLSLFLWAGCGSKKDMVTLSECAPSELASFSISEAVDPPAGTLPRRSTGTAMAFVPDPISSSGNINLSPYSVKLDEYRSSVELAHLSGKGILQGKYIEVLNGTKCHMGFGAFDLKQDFNYSHSDWRFQEAMAYYFGDVYQTMLQSIGYLKSEKPVKIVVHCEASDNAYFARGVNSKGEAVEIVCLGDSARTMGASYADDGVVTLHELQHASTLNNYSLPERMNQLWYDEAGALNEAISDFMGLVFTNSMIPSDVTLDSRVFSRWALGTFDQKHSHVRGAHLCPQYDSKFPECSNYPSFSVPRITSPSTSNISYIYPDGLGWFYPNNTTGIFPISQTFKAYMNQEEIHNAGVLMLGALWDVYVAVRKNHESVSEVNLALSQLVLESLRHLPMPNMTVNHSPVTFLKYAQNLVNYSQQISGLTENDQIAIALALKNRGLYEPQLVSSNEWLGIGEGTNWMIPHTPTPGIFVQDDPNVLVPWLVQMGVNPRLVTQTLSTGLNSRLDPGDVAAIWFDLKNQSDVTAGGVLVTVTSLDPDLLILDQDVNIGYMSGTELNQAQVVYQKVNGLSIVAALNPPDALDPLPVGNTYFKTNPFFNQNWRTAIWVKVNEKAAHGKEVGLEVKATPANGVGSAQIFNVRIN